VPALTFPSPAKNIFITGSAFKFYSKSEQCKFKSWCTFMQILDSIKIQNKNSNKLIGMLQALPKFTVKLFMYQGSFMNKNVWWLNERLC